MTWRTRWVFKWTYLHHLDGANLQMHTNFCASNIALKCSRNITAVLLWQNKFFKVLVPGGLPVGGLDAGNGIGFVRVVAAAARIGLTWTSGFVLARVFGLPWTDLALFLTSGWCSIFDAFMMICRVRFFLFLKKYGSNPAAFCLFSSFSQYNDKYSTILAI